MQLPQFEAHAALEEQHWWFLGRRTIVRTLLNAVLPPSKDKLVLDIGCGTGGLTAFFGKDYRCIGIDPATEAIMFAKQKYADCEFILGKAPDDILDQYHKADAVLLMEVLEHVKEDKSFVRRLIDELKPGAFLFIMAPADPSLWGPHDEGFEHERRYEDATFRALWRGTPVTERLVSFSNARLYPVAKVARMLARLKGSAWGPGDTDLALPAAPLNALFTKIFAGESNRLLKALHRKTPPYRRGVTLLALLQKQ